MNLKKNPINIIVLSDLHCPESFNEVNWIDALKWELESIRKANKLDKFDFLIIPGDISDKCEVEGFETFKRVFEEIKEFFDPSKVFICPGNHCVDANKLLDKLNEKKYYEKLINLKKGKKPLFNLIDEKPVSEGEENFCDVLERECFREYLKVVNEITLGNITKTYGHQVFEDLNTIIVYLNSAWLCLGKKWLDFCLKKKYFFFRDKKRMNLNKPKIDASHISLGCNIYSDIFNDIDQEKYNDYFKLFVFHHNYRFLDYFDVAFNQDKNVDDSDRSIIDKIMKRKSLIINGHNHDYVSDAGSASMTDINHGFSFFKTDNIRKTCTEEFYKFDGNSYQLESGRTNVKIFDQDTFAENVLYSNYTPKDMYGDLKANKVYEKKIAKSVDIEIIEQEDSLDLDCNNIDKINKVINENEKIKISKYNFDKMNENEPNFTDDLLFEIEMLKLKKDFVSKYFTN